jgi:hypothetical protein
MIRRITLLLLIPLTACTGIQETQVYAGPQTPLAGTCDPTSRATLTRRGQEIVVAPNDGTITLEGQITGQTLTAKTTLTGVDKKPYPLVFAGQLTGTTINATLSTPRCRYALALKLTND